MTLRFYIFLSLCYAFLSLAASASITFYNVGQGNCTVVKSPSKKILVIDAGSSNTTGVPLSGIEGDKIESLAKKIVNTLIEDVHTSKWIWFIVSHPDRDHLNLIKFIILYLGVLSDPSTSSHPKLLPTYNIGVLFGGKPDIYTKRDSADLLKFVRDCNIPYKFGDTHCAFNPFSNSYVLDDRSPILPEWDSAAEGSKIDFLSVGAEAMYEKTCTEEENTNAASIVVKIQVGPLSVMLTGDKTEKETKFIINRLTKGGQQGLLHSNILLATHHGSSGDYVEDWAKLVAPVHVVFSAGRSFDHPRSEAFRGYCGSLQATPLHAWHFVQFQGDPINYGRFGDAYFKSLVQEAPRSLDKGRGYIHALTNQNVFVTANQGDITFLHDGSVRFSGPLREDNLSVFPVELVSHFITHPLMLGGEETEKIEEINFDEESSLNLLLSTLARKDVLSLDSLKVLSMKSLGLNDGHAKDLETLIRNRTTLTNLKLTGNDLSSGAQSAIIEAWEHRGLEL